MEMSSRHFKILIWHSEEKFRVGRDLRVISIRFLFRAVDLNGITQQESVERRQEALGQILDRTHT